MNKKQKYQSGFGVLEALLILVIVGMLGFTGWYVWHSKQAADKTLTADNSSTPAPQAKAYKRTTTVPSDWKTYTNTAYKFTAQYPSGWVLKFAVINKKAGQDGPTDFSLNATKVGTLYYNQHSTDQLAVEQLNIQNQSLQETVAQAKKIFYNADNGTKVLSQKSLTIDGHQAVEFRYQQINGTSGPVQDDYYVYAHGNTYAMPTVYESDNQNNPISAKVSLMLFEAIKIQ